MSMCTYLYPYLSIYLSIYLYACVYFFSRPTNLRSLVPKRLAREAALGKEGVNLAVPILGAQARVDSYEV